MGDNGPLVSWVALAIAIVGGLLALLRYINVEISQERKWREEADVIGREQREKLTNDFAAYKLEATEKFAPHGAIEKLEARLVLAIEKIGARQETMLGRMDSLTAELAKRRPST